MLLLGVFASMAVLLAALGIFGVMSYAVAQRSREIGIRMALGAHPARVMRMVLKDAALLIVSGIGIGLMGALALSRSLSGLLFNLSPTDPSTLAGVAALLTAVALLASYFPRGRPPASTRSSPCEANERSRARLQADLVGDGLQGVDEEADVLVERPADRRGAAVDVRRGRPSARRPCP